jgi:hypothetical protein
LSRIDEPRAERREAVSNTEAFFAKGAAMTRSPMRLFIFLAVTCCVIGPVVVRAHHSGSEYAQTTVEIEGTLLEVAWQNPHVHFFVARRTRRAPRSRGTSKANR